LVQDHAVDSRLRKYPSPEASRHLANEIDQTAVDALIGACESSGHVVRDYYKLKSQLLGIRQLYDYDRYAPVEIKGVALPRCDWETACQLVRESYADFSDVLGGVIAKFVDRGWVDAEPRSGKRGGAFCSPTVPSAHPYILMNFTGQLRDVMTLAHELGHGVHQYLSKPLGILQAYTPLTLAETASVFGEMLVFNRLIEEQDDPGVKLSLLCHRLEDAFATVFRQIALTRFERKVHAARRVQELSVEQLDEFWLEVNAGMLGSSVKLTDGYKRWWSYIGHFIHVPFYCYAYAFGELLVLALWRRYRQEGSSFVPRYLNLLQAGGSQSPTDLIAGIGLNINDSDFWESGLSVLAEMLDEAKQLATGFHAT
jgi:oligoendopeptidase F